MVLFDVIFYIPPEPKFRKWKDETKHVDPSITKHIQDTQQTQRSYLSRQAGRSFFSDLGECVLYHRLESLQPRLYRSRLRKERMSET